jgi:RNA polymerase sigma-70 factor (ECF subfamily)
MKDKELIQETSHGNLNAFNELVLKYQDLVFNHAHRLLGNQESAEDITQEAFILAFRKIHQFRGGSFRAWLLRIVTNLCYSEMRTWKRNSFLPLEPLNKDGDINESPYWIQDPSPLPEEIVETSDLQEKLEHGLKKLPGIYRNVVSLIDIQELSYKEAASIMGVSVGTVKSRLARGRMKFQEILKNMDPRSVSGREAVSRQRQSFIGYTNPGYCPTC